MRVFRQKYKDRNGETKESSKWYIQFTDQNADTKRIAGFTDKGATVELGRKVRRMVSICVAQDPPPADLIKWIEGLPAILRNKLVELGLINGQSSVSGKRLADHLKDFIQNLKDRGRTEAYCQLVTTRIHTILNDCRFVQLNDIVADRVESFLAKLQTKGLSQQTRNDYLVAAKNFLNWMVTNRRLSANPLAHMKGGNVKVDRRLERRELVEDEIRWLLATVRTSKTIHGLTGWQRFTLYSVALGTGLRASELASLTAQSFDLKSEPPTVRILAKNEKARRGDTLPLPHDLAELLENWFPSLESDANLWPGPWAAHKAASKFVQHDLKSARDAWLKTAKTDAERVAMAKTDFLSYRDSEDRQADFHSLRHTFLSRLGRSGASAKVMQRLARHSTVELTLGRYTHAGLYDLQSAVEKLPPLPSVNSHSTKPEALRATGTTAADVLPSGLPFLDAEPRISVPFSAQAGKQSTKAGKDETAEKTRVFPAVQSDLTERGGFEPPVGFDPHAALAKRCYRPLSHLSGSGWTQHIYSRDAGESKPDWMDSPGTTSSSNFG